MVNLSYIEYDHDEPYAMEMVWNIWVVDKDHIGCDSLDAIKDQWIMSKHRLAIPQMDWTRIVVRML